MTSTRTATDASGSIAAAADRYWVAQTPRLLQIFKIVVGLINLHLAHPFGLAPLAAPATHYSSCHLALRLW